MIRADAATATLLVGLLVLASAGVAAAGSGVGSPTLESGADDPTEALAVTDATLESGGVGTAEVILTEAPEGLAGFEVTLETGDAAAVTDVAYPDAYGMTTEPAIEDDGRTVTIEAADLTDEVEPGASDVPLASLELEGVEPGTTEVRVAAFQVDADGGAAVDPALESGTVTVESDDEDGAAANGDGGGTDADGSAGSADESGSASAADGVENVDELGTGPALGLLAVLTALLAVGHRRRRD